MAALSIRGPVEAVRQSGGVEGDRSRHRKRRIHRSGWTIRLRQVHAAQHRRRAGSPERRDHRNRWTGRQRRRAEGPRHRHGVPVLCALSVDDGAPEHHVRNGMPPCPEGGAGRGAWRMWPGCCRSSRCSTAGRRSFPAASASAWRWAAPWCAIRCCSCSTNRSPISTQNCASRCGWRSSGCISASARPSSMSPTTRSRR